MYLVDSFERHLEPIYFHHEQAASMAAEGYSKVSGKLGVVCVTSGPGGTNALTGVLGQWTDSVPVLYLSGNVRTQMSSKGTALRQRGDQENDIVRMVEGITKEAIYCCDHTTVLCGLNNAIYAAKNGRKGPVWVDIPLDIQCYEIGDNR